MRTQEEHEDRTDNVSEEYRYPKDSGRRRVRAKGVVSFLPDRISSNVSISMLWRTIHPLTGKLSIKDDCRKNLPPYPNFHYTAGSEHTAVGT